jgi:hypothetical protein
MAFEYLSGKIFRKSCGKMFRKTLLLFYIHTTPENNIIKNVYTQRILIERLNRV